ncbi:ParB/RepB/Spo0J family partition protein [Acidobacteriota bacterium]
MTKKALGKGLKAFMPEEFGIIKEERFMEMDIDQLKPNPLQPRMRQNPESLDELAQSIKETGVLQPVVAVPEEGVYKIIVGERRWRAAKKAGLQKIPVLIRTLNKKQQHEVSLVENLQRDDLNPLEVALAYQRMAQEFQLTQQDIADKVGKNRTSVANTLRLLKLPQEVQDLIADGKLSMGHAKALIALEDPRLQKSMARKIVTRNLSVRKVEQWVRKLQDTSEEKPKPPVDPDLLHVQEDLLTHLGTKVAISGDQNKGVLKIYYYTLDDLNRIYEKIKGVTE